jgi:acylphosphatase
MPETRSPTQRRRVTFEGRVQGVGFRATARSLARPHPVTGWVRNEPDGSVLIEVQGEGAAIDAFLADVRSRMSRYINRETPVGIPMLDNERGFDVRY